MANDNMPRLTKWYRSILAVFHVERDASTPRLNLELVRQFWQVAVPFWRRGAGWRGYLALALYTGYAFGSSLVLAGTAKYAGDQLNSLSAHDSFTFYRLILISSVIQIASTILFLISNVPYSIMLVRWRQWMTAEFVREYLEKINYYRMNLSQQIDNPDERIAVDVSQFIEFPISVLFGLVRAISNLFVFGFILWHFAWYLVPACAFFYLLYSLGSLLFARPLMALSYKARRLEGDFRFALVNVRTNAESIAFMRGEPVERAELLRRNDLVMDNAIRNVYWGMSLAAWALLSDSAAGILPGFLIAPLVLRGVLTISAFTQAQNAWSQLGSAFGWFAEQARSFAYEGAIIARIHKFHQYCTRVPDRINVHERISTIESSSLAAVNLTLLSPDGQRTLVSKLNFSLGADHNLLVTGMNGVGKSSLLRGLAGLWAFGEGQIFLPPPGKVMFLPQRPYMSLGRLSEQLTYPLTEESIDVNKLREVLNLIHLDYLEDRFGGLHAKLDWTHVLSPGEQQRLAFGRALLRRPNLVILDEATSAIDVEGERLLYDLLRDRDCSYLSVAHRVSLYQYHDSVLELKGEGAWELRSIPSVAM